MTATYTFLMPVELSFLIDKWINVNYSSQISSVILSRFAKTLFDWMVKSHLM